MTKRNPEDYYTEVAADKAYATRWKDTPKSLAEQDEQWRKADRLAQQRATRAARRNSAGASV